MKNKKIGVFGLWHLGCVYATSLAKLGYEVEASDFDNRIVSDLLQGRPPVFEPEMKELIEARSGDNLNFVEASRILKDKDYVFVTHDLPVSDLDKVSTKLIDKTVKLIEKFGEEKTVFVVSSQIPLGTCRQVAKIAKKLIYFPENVRLGKAYESFLSPERIILGSDQQILMEKFEKDFKVFDCPFIKMSWESAEMVKHALNSYLATCVSYSSELSDLCELLGANMLDVVGALKSDRRVSPFAPINPGMGFAGGTLGRDIQSLKSLGVRNKYKTKLFNAVYTVNSERLDWLLKKIKSKIGKIDGKRIGILGLTYKPGTNTLRRSMSLGLAEKLAREKVVVCAFDPVIKEAINQFEYISIKKNYDDFFDKLDAVVLMTEWPEFREIDIQRMGKLMRNRIVFDTKNFLDKKRYEEDNYLCFGTGV